MSSTPHFDENTARQVLLVQAFEVGPELPGLWSREDRAWATRVAREAVPAGATPAQALVERCRHVLHRLLPREAAAQRALSWRGWNGAWLPLALLLGLLAGVAIDAIGSGQTINLLAPPVWGVVVWNVAVYLLLTVMALRRAGPGVDPTSSPPGRLMGLRSWLARRTADAGLAGSGKVTAPASSLALARYAKAWAQHGAPLGAARAALLLHAAAAALALGLVLGLYTRGLVLDYRAAWQSTFLDAQQVQGLLSTLLAPAVAATGITVPDAAAIQALRIAPGQPATAGAAPWLHLYAAMLALGVVLPRLLLAALAAARALRGSRNIALPLQEPYFQSLLRGVQGGASVVQVVPQGAAPSPAATLSLQAWLRAALGEQTVLHMADAVAYGQEERSDTVPLPAGTTLRVLLVDLSSTPEPDTAGRLLTGLRQASPSLPLLMLADETSMQARFAHLPQRLQQRREAWAALASALGAGFVTVPLKEPDLAQAEAAFSRAWPPAAAAPVATTGTFASGA